MCQYIKVTQSSSVLILCGIILQGMLTNTLGAQRSGQPTSKHQWSNDLILGNMHVSVNCMVTGDGLVKSLLSSCTKGGWGGGGGKRCQAFLQSIWVEVGKLLSFFLILEITIFSFFKRKRK